MNSKLFEIIEIDFVKLGIVVMLVMTTLFGSELKSSFIDTDKDKFVIDSFYNFENWQDSHSLLKAEN